MTLKTGALNAEVIAVVREVLGDGRVEIHLGTSLIHELGVDSLTMVRLDILLRDRIGLALSLLDIDGVDTVADLVQALLERGRPAEAVA